MVSFWRCCFARSAWDRDHCLFVFPMFTFFFFFYGKRIFLAGHMTSILRGEYILVTSGQWQVSRSHGALLRDALASCALLFWKTGGKRVVKLWTTCSCSVHDLPKDNSFNLHTHKHACVLSASQSELSPQPAICFL